MFSTWLGMVLLFALFAMIAFAVVKASPRGNTFEKKRGEARAKKLEDAQKEYLPALVVAGGEPAKSPGVALLANRSPIDGRAAAYLCHEYQCDVPATSPAALRDQLTLSSRA